MVMSGSKQVSKWIDSKRIDSKWVRSERIGSAKKGSEDFERIDGVKLAELVERGSVGLTRSSEGTGCPFYIAVTIVSRLFLRIAQDIIGFGNFLLENKEI